MVSRTAKGMRTSYVGRLWIFEYDRRPAIVERMIFVSEI